MKCAAPDAGGGINGKVWFQANLCKRKVFAYFTLFKPAAFDGAMQLFASRLPLDRAPLWRQTGEAARLTSAHMEQNSEIG
ncbi:MAG: hypothetical protein ACJAU6_002771 [Alphaproteobacteria bacterium]